MSESGGLVREGTGRRAAVAVLFAIALSIGLVVVTADGPDAVSGGLGGDYASFYAAGDIVRNDVGIDPERFYDPPTQFAAQEPVLPSDSEGNLFFAYPAFFVAPYAALASLGFVASYLVHTLLMVAAVVGALVLLRPCSATLRSHFVEALAVALTFYPLFRGVTGGQNTALSLLAFAVIWRSLHDGREAPAGIAAALLLFKPPLALPILGLFLISRRFVALVSAAVTTLGLYALGALLTGPDWLQPWADAISFLDRVDTPFNVQNFVSLPGAAEAIFGIDSTAATLFGFGLAGVVALALVAMWSRHGHDVDVLVVATVAGSLLISPHALYYDAGILVLVGLLLADRRPEWRRWIVAGWAFGFAHLAAATLTVDPLVLLVVAAFGLAVAADGRPLLATTTRR